MDGRRRSGDAGGQPDDLRRSVLLVQRRRQRLACQLESRTRERGGVPVGREGAQDENRLRSAELGREPLLRAEGVAGAK